MSSLSALTPTPTAGWQTRHERLHIVTDEPTQFVDITDHVTRLVASAGISDGLVNVQALHTTTAIVVNEHEPLLLEDFACTLERVAPGGLPYRHDDFDVRRANLTPEERINGHAHCRALVLAPSACLNVMAGRLQTGRWQRVFLVELDGPRQRAVSVMVLGVAQARPGAARESRRHGAPERLPQHRANGEGRR